MRVPIPESGIGMMILGLWLFVMLVAICGYWALKVWRRRHPRRHVVPVSYGKDLKKRLRKKRHVNKQKPGTRNAIRKN